MNFKIDPEAQKIEIKRTKKIVKIRLNFNNQKKINFPILLSQKYFSNFSISKENQSKKKLTDFIQLSFFLTEPKIFFENSQKSFKNSQKVGHKKFVICLQKVLKTYFSCFANIVLGVCSIVCVLSLDPFFSCVFRLNVDDVNVIFLSIFSTSQTAT